MTVVGKSLHGFILGPHNFGDTSFHNFAPEVYFKETDPETGKKVVNKYRMMVYVGHKTILAILFDHEVNFTYDHLKRLDAHL